MNQLLTTTIGGRMANSIDIGTIVLGAAVGYGLRNEIRCAGSIARNGLLAGLAGAAITAAQQAGQGGQAPAGQAGGQGKNP